MFSHIRRHPAAHGLPRSPCSGRHRHIGAVRRNGGTSGAGPTTGASASPPSSRGATTASGGPVAACASRSPPASSSAPIREPSGRIRFWKSVAYETPQPLRQNRAVDGTVWVKHRIHFAVCARTSAAGDRAHGCAKDGSRRRQRGTTRRPTTAVVGRVRGVGATSRRPGRHRPCRRLVMCLCPPQTNRPSDIPRRQTRVEALQGIPGRGVPAADPAAFRHAAPPHRQARPQGPRPRTFGAAPWQSQRRRRPCRHLQPVLPKALRAPQGAGPWRRSAIAYHRATGRPDLGPKALIGVATGRTLSPAYFARRGSRGFKPPWPRVRCGTPGAIFSRAGSGRGRRRPGPSISPRGTPDRNIRRLGRLSRICWAALPDLGVTPEAPARLVREHLDRVWLQLLGLSRRKERDPDALLVRAVAEDWPEPPEARRDRLAATGRAEDAARPESRQVGQMALAEMPRTLGLEWAASGFGPSPTLARVPSQELARARRRALPGTRSPRPPTAAASGPSPPA